MAYLVVLTAALSRFVLHIPNFSPVFGALLYSGAHLPRRDRIWFPVAALALTDPFLTWFVHGMKFSWKQSIVWVGFAAVALIGTWLGSRITAGRFAAAALAGPTAFYLITNFGVWLGGHGYAHNSTGLMACYVAAIPFYRNSLISSVLFGGVLFGFHELYRRKAAVRQLGTEAHAR